MSFAAIQAPTMGSPIESFQMGQQLGAGNNPLTALGQAVKGTLETYKTHLAAQNTANIQGSKNQNALDVQTLQNEGAQKTANTTGNRALEVEKYKREAYAPSPEDAAMYRDMQLNPDKYLKNAGDVKMGPHVKFVNGQPVGVDYRDVRSAGAFDFGSGDGEVVTDDAEAQQFPFLSGGAKPQVPQAASKGKQLTPDAIKMFTAQAKGDINLAKQLAAQAGYK